jgi:hypothetical protein
MIQAYVDESGGKGQGTVFVFSALVSSVEHWLAFTEAWQACLDEAPTLKYFKMNEAAGLSGQFSRFRENARNKKVEKLCRIIGSSQLMEHHVVVKLSEFFDVMEQESGGHMAHPYFFPFHMVILALAWELAGSGLEEKFEIFFDENVIFGPRAKAWYPVILATMDDPEMRAVMPTEPLFRSDLDVLPLQACDLTAWLHRRENNEGLGEFSWMPQALQGLIPSQLSNRLTRLTMERIVGLSYDLPPERRALAADVIEAYKETFNDTWPPSKRIKPSRRQKKRK